MPNSAYDIIEQHNLDTNTTVVEFSFSIHDKGSLFNLKKVPTDINSVNRLPRVWKLIWNGIELYNIEELDEKGYLAINWKQDRALY